MPSIVDYTAVVAATDRQALVCLYPNSGAFGFRPDVPTHHVGWVAGEDASLRPAARELAITIPPPAVPNLARLAVRAWRELFGPVDSAASCDAWLLPKAHWAYELDFGSGAWLPDLLRSNGVDADVLAARHDGSAASFSPSEAASFEAVTAGLLDGLFGSDFQLLFPGRDVVCTVHHHKQLWWTSPDERLIARLREMAEG